MLIVKNYSNSYSNESHYREEMVSFSIDIVHCDLVEALLAFSRKINIVVVVLYL
jgi:hypothetical protein